ncbi:MAG: OmpH family outer membrane protein [Pseudomonadota bacterium]
MRRVKTAFMATFITFCFLVASSFGADVAKIGIVDFQKILETSSAGKKAQAEISKQGKNMEADLKERGAEIDEIKKKLEREALVMSKEMREEREREIRIKINDFKTLQQKYMTDFKLLEQRHVGRIQKDLLELIEDIGKKEGYLLILEKREGGVLYAPKTNDITDKLIQIYNADFAAREKEETKTKKE